MDSFSSIDALLRTLSRRHRRRAALGAAIFAISAAAMVPLAVALLSTWLHKHESASQREFRLAAAWGAVGAAGLTLSWLWRRWKEFDLQLAAAQLFGGDDLQSRSLFRSALELRSDPSAEMHFSKRLLEALFELVSARSQSLDPARTADVPLLRGPTWVLVAGTVLALHVLAWVGGGKLFREAYADLWHPTVSATQGRSMPITGEVNLTLLYPAHTGRGRKTLMGTGGEVTAPKGTRVELQTRADRIVERASILLSVEGAEPEEVGLSVSESRDLSGSFLVKGSGSYRFKLIGSRGQLLAQGNPISVTVEPDAYPTVAFTSPAAELELNQNAEVLVSWSASDDVGLSSLDLVTQVGNAAPTRQLLRDFLASGRAPKRANEAFQLSPSRLGAKEGERVLYFLEIADNDRVDGPKRAASSTQVLSIYSRVEHRRLAVEEAQKLWERMVDLLGDRLARFGKSPLTGLVERGEQMAADLSRAAASQRRDRAAPSELSAALANAGLALSELHALSRQLVSRGGAASISISERIDARLERDLLYLEALLDHRRAQDLIEMGHSLAADRRQLARLLEKASRRPDPDSKAELLTQVSHLRQHMNEMLVRMSELGKGISDAHMNAEALAELSREHGMTSKLDEIERKAQSGDLAGALADIDALGNALDKMMVGLQKTAGEPGLREAELSRKLGRFKQALDALSRDQSELTKEASQLRHFYQQQALARLANNKGVLLQIDAWAKESIRHLEAAEPHSTPRDADSLRAARDRIGDVSRALVGKEFAAARQSIGEVLASLEEASGTLKGEQALAERFPSKDLKAGEVATAAREVDAALTPARRIKAELEKLFPDPKQLLSAEQLRHMEQLGHREKGLEKQAAEAEALLAALREEAPVLPRTVSEAMGEAGVQMDAAADKLRGGNVERGAEEAGHANDTLRRIGDGLDRMVGEKAGRRGGIPLPWAELALEAEGQGQEGGSDGVGTKVEIPKAESFAPANEWRKEAVEAMKQGAPESYREDLQHYYQELVR